MSTRLQLITATRVQIDERDPNNTHWDDTEISTAIGQGIRFLGTLLEWAEQIAEATTVLDQRVYVLPADFVSLIEVYLDGKPLIVVDRSDMVNIDGNWQEAESGKPAYAYKADNRKIGLHPPPNSEYENLALQIQQIKVPDTLTDDVSEPDLHMALHDCLPFYAAYLLQNGIGNRTIAKGHWEDFKEHWKLILPRVQRFSDAILAFRWPGR